MERCVNALKQWTGKTMATTIYDSTVDEFTADGLFVKVKGKPNIALVGFTEDGDAFGGFYSVAVSEFSKTFLDPTIVVFSFESHGRCETPQRFVPKEGMKDCACVMFCMNDRDGFVRFGVFSAGGFWLGDESSKSFCQDLSFSFEELEDTTLTGKSGICVLRPFHHCTRLVAVQLA